MLDFKLISDNGMKILSRDINADFEDLRNKQLENKSRMYICLYFTCVYHISKCFSSFIDVLLASEEGKYFELREEIQNIDEELIPKLVNLKIKIICN